MTYAANRVRETLRILDTATKITRAVQEQPSTVMLFDLDRDIYAETVAATGIDPRQPT